MKYLQPLVKIPELGPDPPSFLLPGQLIELELARQVRVTAHVDEEASIGSLVEPGEVEPPLPTPPANRFDSQFGAKPDDSFDFTAPRSPVKDERCVQGSPLSLRGGYLIKKHCLYNRGILMLETISNEVLMPN